jgi:hypothetical protein
MRVFVFFTLLFFQCLLSHAEDRRFVRVNLCGIYDESWKGRLGEDKKCLITEIVCQRAGNQFLAGSVDSSLEFHSFKSQISSLAASLATATSEEKRNGLKPDIADLSRRATWAAPACKTVAVEAAITVTPISVKTVTPLTPLPTTGVPVSTTKTPTPFATSSVVSSSTPTGTQTGTPTPNPTSTPTIVAQPTATATSVPVGNGDFVRVFPSIQKSLKGAVAGDFDGDGDSDAAVGLSNSSQVRIYNNEGNGIFSEGALLSVGTSPGDLHEADIDLDGILDLVIGYEVGTSITIALGRGSGAFATPTTHLVSSSSSAQTIYIGHFDNGPTLDIAVGLKNLNKITISRGNGDGTFQAAEDISFTIPGPMQIDGADLDLDGDLDLVAATSNGGVAVVTNDGSGSFSGAGTISCGSPSNVMNDVKVLDYNGDLDPDIVALNGTASNICLSTGSTAASFNSATTITTGSGTPERLVSRDFDNNLVPDLLVGNSNGRLARFSGQLVAPYFVAEPDPVMIGGSTVTSMSLSDLNGGGIKDDLIVATDSSATLNGLAVLQAVSGSSPDFVPPGSYRTGSGPVDVVVGDLNGDSLNDMVTVNTDAKTVSVFLNLGGGVFGTKVDYPVANDPKAIAIGEITGDGIPDVVVATTNTGAILWSAGDGS